MLGFSVGFSVDPTTGCNEVGITDGGTDGFSVFVGVTEGHSDGTIETLGSALGAGLVGANEDGSTVGEVDGASVG